MLQRIQTLYLLLVFIVSFLFYFFPVYGLVDGTKKFILGEFEMAPVYIIYIIILNSLTGLLAISTIFLCKKRLLQIKLGKINLLFTALLIFVLFLYIENRVTDIDSVTYLAATYFPILMFLFIYLANRSILKDEELVRSADVLGYHEWMSGSGKPQH